MTLRHNGLSHRPGISGFRRWNTKILTCLVIVLASWPCEATFFSAEEISFLFGPNGCIEGTLTMPSSVILQQAAPAQPQVVYDTITTSRESSETKTLDSNEVDTNLPDAASILANNKEKTPMCLVNELARYNKIPHQYRLTNEQGPAHRKQFTVTLKLGEEEYTAEGASIKKAQHEAARIALAKTNYKHPPPKPLRNIRLGKSNITPTVELNAWAMKRGELATYHFIAPSGAAIPAPNVGVGPSSGVGPGLGPGVGPMTNFCPQVNPAYNNFTAYNGYRPQYNQIRAQHNEFHRRSMYRPHFPPQYDYQRYAKGPTTLTSMPPIFAVMVRVGTREFTGEGPTAQMARHAAAAKALNDIRQLPLPDDKACVVTNNETLSANTLTNKDETSTLDIKSPISLVHEVALRRNLNVKFEVVKVTGPPHMRSFHTVCSVGDFTTEGVGNGKKVSKKRASEKMLDELKRLPPESPCMSTSSASNTRTKRKPTQKKKSRNLIKEAKPATPTEANTAVPEKDEMNPISRLIQIQQAKKEPDPVYTLLEERGAPRRREFIMSVKVGNLYNTGSGPNKKLAKRAAAEGMLQELGYSRPSTKTTNGREARKVTFVDDVKVVETSSVGGTSGRQLVPGILLMSDNSYSPPTKGSGVNPQAASMAKELLSGSATMDSQSQPQSTQFVRPKDQLMYLASLLNFKVQFSDFPKGNHSEYLSLVSLSTSPAQVCHGAGLSVDASHDQAALTALRMLAEMGLDMIKNEPPSGPAGDGVQMSQVYNVVKGSTMFEDQKPM